MKDKDKEDLEFEISLLKSRLTTLDMEIENLKRLAAWVVIICVASYLLDKFI